MSTLEERYRRLLVLYPREHRARHEEEMIGVMLDQAEPGRRHPDPRDVIDLLKGGLQVRLRRSAGPASGTYWRDALNVAAIVVPLHPFLLQLGGVVPLLWVGLSTTDLRQSGILLGPLIPELLPGALILLLALRGSRRAAAWCAWAWTAASSVLYVVLTLRMIEEMGPEAFPVTPPNAGNVALYALPGVLSALLLTVAPCPAAGAALIGHRRLLRWSVAAVLGLSAAGVVTTLLTPEAPVTPLIEMTLIAMAYGAGSRTRVGRRVVLLTLPALAVLGGMGLSPGPGGEGWPALAVRWLLVATVFVVARRGFHPYGSGTVSSPERLV
ncbi:hypothetical protein GCM10017673_50830 [Streptosporangium violaceochromogenes]|nr:hypothetical protein GCM10017673_50830 [Streptosporangium violaceochromogenes]